MVHTRYDNRRASFIHSFIHISAPLPTPPPPPAPTVLYIFPIVPKHRFPSDHTGPEWFSTHRRTIHPLDAWTPVSSGSHWAKVIQHPPTHHPSTGYLNTSFHRITLGQSDSAPTGTPSIHWMPELVVDEPEPLPCPVRPCWPISCQLGIAMSLIDWLTNGLVELIY